MRTLVAKPSPAGPSACTLALEVAVGASAAPDRAAGVAMVKIALGSVNTRRTATKRSARTLSIEKHGERAFESDSPQLGPASSLTSVHCVGRSHFTHFAADDDAVARIRDSACALSVR